MKIDVKLAKFKQNTNVLAVDIPAHLRLRHMCGIDWLDETIGGFVPTTVTMLTGDPGCGKSTLLRQLADGITGQGHACLMNTGEESVEQVAMSTERLNLKHGFVIGQDTMCDAVINHAENVKARNPGKQLFLLQDSLVTLDDGFYKDGTINSQTPIRVTEQLTSWAKKTHAIVVFINQVTKNGAFVGKNTVKHIIDSHIELKFDREKKSETYGERIFSVSKNRWACSGQEFVVKMGSTGLKVN